MKNRPVSAKNLAFLIIIFAVTSFACSISTTSGNSEATAQALEATSQALQVQQTNAAMKTDTPTVTPEPPTATPEPPTPTLEPTKKIVLGKEYESVEGGFVFQMIPDYLLEELETAFVVMSAEDSDPDIGPLIVVFSGDSDSNLTIHQSLEEVSADFAGDNDLEFTGKHQITVDGNSGLAVEVSGEMDGKAVGGRLIMVKPDPTRQFVMAGLAPESRWDELARLVDAVLETVTIKAVPTPTVRVSEAKNTTQLAEIKLGKEYESEEGYFTVKKASGYTMDLDSGFAIMTAEDADPVYGPILMAYTDNSNTVSSLEENLEEIAKTTLETEELEIVDKEQVAIDGKKGLTGNTAGYSDGVIIGVRIAVVRLSEGHLFIQMGMAAEDRWDELVLVFDAVLDSVTFMDIPVEEPLCGNGTCDVYENSGNCPQDCKSKVTCGDGICEPYVETKSSCPKDCGSTSSAPLCGNGVCGDFENAGNCPQDCGSASEPLCGNGVCGDFENAGNCPQDCAKNEPLCGNGVCGDFENPGNCPQDCGTGDLCGDGICEPYMETSGNCPQDCGS